MKSDRRKFIRNSFASASGIAAASLFPAGLFDFDLHRTSHPVEIVLEPSKRPKPAQSIKFSVIGINHGHIYSMVDSLIEGGGELVSVFAKEPDLLKDFIKRYPKAAIARNEEEILGDMTIRLVASASIPVERAPLGIRVMESGKDFMVDKPGILTFGQLKEVKKVQANTKRIYSIMYSERLGNPASVKAGELINAGAIGKVIQTIGLGPHRMTPATRPTGSLIRLKREVFFAILAHTSAISSFIIQTALKPRWHIPRLATSIPGNTRLTRISAT